MIHTQTALDCSTSTCAAVSRAPSHSAFVEDDLPISPHWIAGEQFISTGEQKQSKYSIFIRYNGFKR
jgi:hypothetical protein